MKNFIYKGENLREARFPLGGIGAGSVCINGGARLVDWEIMIEREIETKFLMDKAAFERLMSVARELCPDIPEVIEQSNHYYDTEDFELFRHGITLRTREQHGRFTTTMKVYLARAEGIGDARTAVEMQVPIDGDSLPERFDAYRLLGHLYTKRTRFSLSDNTKLDCDVNQYLGVEDYEVEVETAGQIPEELNALLPAELNPKGKYERFLERLVRERTQSGWSYS